MKIAHKYIKAVFYASIYILLFLMFRHQIGDLLWDANIKWLADCDIVCGGILIMIVWAYLFYLLIRKYNNCLFGYHLISFCLFGLFLYLYYRCLDSTFYFWGIELPCLDIELAYVDVIIPVTVVAIWKQGRNILYSIGLNNAERNASVLMKDDPLKEEEEDLLGYREIVRTLLSDLEGVDLKDKSYSVGITGEWGVGKSSLFNIFRYEIAKLKGTLVYNFYPRTSASIQDIQQDFFDGFSQTLSKHHSGVHRIVRLYQEALQVIDISWASRLFSFFTTLTAECGKERINDIIKETGVRIFVLVDDLDRLTAPEILEVMKLIDRNGGFVNTIFITAYDKDYVNEVLNNHLRMGNKTDYSDKYFSYEFALPVQNVNDLNRLAKYQIGQSMKFDEIDILNKEELLKQWDEIASTITGNLHTLRHVKRYMNLLLSRYSKVKNDVNFKDFAYLTLLRYKDLAVYHGLIEGKFIERGKSVKDKTDKVFYLKSDYLIEVKEYSKWDGTNEILTKLFKNEDELAMQKVGYYQRLRSVSALSNYYYDYKPGELYYHDLISLYRADTNGEVFSVMKELLGYDEKNKTFLEGRYQSVEDFLIQRPLSMLRSVKEFKRLLILALTLIRYSQRTSAVESFVMSLMTSQVASHVAAPEKEDDFLLELTDAIENAIPEFPLELGQILLKIIYSQTEGVGDSVGYVFIQKQFVKWANLCQLYYINYHIEESDHDVIARIVELSKIYETTSSTIVTRSAQMELLEYMSKHPNEFASFVCNVYKAQPEEKDLVVCYYNGFSPKSFFPYDEMTFDKWVRENVKNDSLKDLLLLIGRTKSNQVSIELRPEEYSVDVKDFDEVWKVIKLRQEENEEQKLMNVIKKNTAISLVMLSKETGIKKDVVKTMINNLVEKGKLGKEMNDIPDSIAAFEVGDFVRLKDSNSNKQKYSDREAINIYKILKIEKGKYKLSSIENLADSSDIEAIPIDGIHDKDIYFDPIIAASIISPEGSIPVHRTDYSYYMDKFESRFDVDKRSYAEIVKDRGYRFVHEVQHWLREAFGSDELKKRY